MRPDLSSGPTLLDPADELKYRLLRGHPRVEFPDVGVIAVRGALRSLRRDRDGLHLDGVVITREPLYGLGIAGIGGDLGTYRGPTISPTGRVYHVETVVSCRAIRPEEDGRVLIRLVRP